MNIIEYRNGGAYGKEMRVIALGFFDGVHLGHRKLLECARAETEKRGVKFSVFTFVSETFPQKNSTRVYSTERKLELLASLGADEAIIADIDDIRELSPEEFAERVLISELSAVCTVSGFDFRFGKGALGDSELLKRLLSAHGADSLTVPEVSLDGEKISTTKIKALLADGNTESANILLGEPYTLKGEVARGLGLGHRLGIPTVNCALDFDRCPLKRGVYRTAVRIDGTYHLGITNIGECPTFGRRELHSETNILDFEEELYGESVDILFLSYLREERAFENKDDLIEQIIRDRLRAILDNKEIKDGKFIWQAIGRN